MSDLRHDWFRWPDVCWAITTRDGHEDACGKPAVAVAVYDRGDDGEFEPHAYPVCKHHARGREMLALAEIIRLAQRKERIYTAITEEQAKSDGGYVDGLEAAWRIVVKELAKETR